jgi:hypothetical protein
VLLSLERIVLKIPGKMLAGCAGNVAFVLMAFQLAVVAANIGWSPAQHGC